MTDGSAQPAVTGLQKAIERLETESVQVFGPVAEDFFQELLSGNLGALFEDFKRIFNGAASPKNAAAPTAPELASRTAPTASDAAPAAKAVPAVSLDQDRRDTDAPDPTFSEADHARAASFGAIATRPGEGNERMERGADINGEWSIGSGYGGAITEVNGIPLGKTAEGDDDDDGQDDAIETLRDAVERKQDEERKEWEEQTHSYAGYDLTGAEWTELGEKLSKDTPLRRWLTAKIKKDGYSDAEAKELTNDVALRTTMQGLPKDQWTPEMKALDQKLADDLALAKKVATYTHDAVDFSQGHAGPEIAVDKITSNSASTYQSVDTGADAFGSAEEEKAPTHKSDKEAPVTAATQDKAFASAPDLAAHHRQALVATEPLDSPKPVQTAAIIKQAPNVAASGFAV